MLRSWDAPGTCLVAPCPRSGGEGTPIRISAWPGGPRDLDTDASAPSGRSGTPDRLRKIGPNCGLLADLDREETLRFTLATCDAPPPMLRVSVLRQRSGRSSGQLVCAPRRSARRFDRANQPTPAELLASEMPHREGTVIHPQATSPPPKANWARTERWSTGIPSQTCHSPRMTKGLR